MPRVFQLGKHSDSADEKGGVSRKEGEKDENLENLLHAPLIDSARGSTREMGDQSTEKSTLDGPAHTFDLSNEMVAGGSAQREFSTLNRKSKKRDVSLRSIHAARADEPESPSREGELLIDIAASPEGQPSSREEVEGEEKDLPSVIERSPADTQLSPAPQELLEDKSSAQSNCTDRSFASTSSQNVEILEGDLEIFELLGKGAFGEVMRGLFACLRAFSPFCQSSISRLHFKSLDFTRKVDKSLQMHSRVEARSFTTTSSFFLSFYLYVLLCTNAQGNINRRKLQ